MKIYDMVQVTSIRDVRFDCLLVPGERHPLVGDIGTIVMDYGEAFEVECCDQERTIWLASMFRDELKLL